MFNREYQRRATRIGLGRMIADSLYKRPEPSKPRPKRERREIPNQLRLDFDNLGPLADLFSDE
ncbi:MAG: hypothetical protein ACM3WP_24020 [Acidobacteriota bacterium]